MEGTIVTGEITLVGILVWILIGAIAGWLAALIVRGGGMGFVVNVVLGIVGAVIGGWLLGALGLSIGTGFFAAIVNAVIGAVVLLLVIRLVKRA